MSFGLLSSLRHPHFNIVKASCQRLIANLKEEKEVSASWKQQATDSQELLTAAEAELAETLEKLSKAESKVVSYSKKNTQLEVLLQSEREEKQNLRRDLEAKEAELARHISDNMTLRADVRRLQMELEIATDKIIILEQVAVFQDTKSQTLQKSVESLLATMSGHENYGNRAPNQPEQTAT